ASLSNSVSPAMAIRPRSGVSNPATMLRMLLFPAPDGPMSAISPASLRHRSAMVRPGMARSMSISKDMAAIPARDPPRQQFRQHQRAQRQQDRDDGEAGGDRFRARHLHRGIDGDRQGPRLARYVGYEGDGGAELADG